jgi:hypothetical protein
MIKLQHRLTKVTKESKILHVNMTQEQKEAEYKQQQQKLILLTYYWLREEKRKHWKHYFREFAKYFDFTTPR